MAKTLRTLTDADFTTKGNTLTWEELDQNFIDLQNEKLAIAENLADLNNVTTAQSNLKLKDGTADLNLNTININGSAFVGATRDLTATTGVFSSTLTTNGELDVNANITIDDVTTLSTDTYLGGFAGSGLQLERDANGHWNLTLDSITARRRATFYELLLQQLRVGRGNEIFRSGMKAASVDVKEAYTAVGSISTQVGNFSDAVGVSHHIFQEEDLLIPLSTDDLIRQQTFDGRNTKLMEAFVVSIENGDPDPTVNTTARYAAINVQSGSNDPEAGDEWVAYGHPTNTDRQGFVGIFSEDDDAPFIRIVNGITQRSEFGSMNTLVAQVGRLDNITDSNFAELDGTQTNMYGIYTNKGFFRNVNVRGVITVTGDDAASSSIDGDSLTTGSVTAAKIAADTITASEIAADTITASEIAAGTITATEVATNTLTANEIDVDNLFAEDITITGKITNSGGDFRINANGFLVSQGTSTYDAKKAYTVGADAGAFWVDGSFVRLEGLDRSLELKVPSSTLLNLDASSSGSAMNIKGDNIRMPNLPTTDPGTTGELWNDSGTVKISL